MAHSRAILTSCVIPCVFLGLAVGGSARTKVREDPLDSQKGAKLASRIPCDGVTNPEDQIKLVSTFSAGTVERAFRINVYEDRYCKHMDLGFKCLDPGQVLWKEEWSVTNSHPQGESGSFGLASCLEQGSKEPPQIVLSGWYREPGADQKRPDPNRPWKQADIKNVASRWETYEFADPAGGTARVEITRQ